MANPPNAICIPCGHVVMCGTCVGDFVRNRHGDCPVCRHTLTGWTITFLDGTSRHVIAPPS